jgi:DNA primase
MIPRDFVQALLGRVDIVDVIESRLPLKKSGSNYIACCPFHNEKTPSFNVSPSRQSYHCFGCGAHGSAISFVMEYGGTGFVEAVRELAEHVGMAVPQERVTLPTEAREEPNLNAILGRAFAYYRSQLKESETAIGYLKRRGVSGQIAARFGIGYAPPGWQGLAAVFPDYGGRALLDSGLVVDSDEGRRYDRFRDRIMFPIFNGRGDVIGFGGRILGDGEPKYLNSPETALFEKGRELYGLPQARRAIRKTGRIVIVEGYMDVIALAQHGLEYTAATLGTATTAAHVQKLLRIADRLIFCFDGDEAGRRAAWRALEASLPQLIDGKNVSFAFLPQGEDPDSYIRGAGKDAFEHLVAEARPLSAYLFQEITREIDLNSEEGRARLLQSAKALLPQVTAPALSLLLRRRAAELARIDQRELDTLMGIITGGPRPSTPVRMRREPPSLERKLITHLLWRPELAQKSGRPALESREGDLGTFAELLDFLSREPHIPSHASILEAFRGTRHGPLLAELSAEAFGMLGSFTEPEIEQEFMDGILRLGQKARRQQMDALIRKAREGGLTVDERQLYQTLAISRS